ncbi:MAG: hypothetical protein KC466_11495 [Myxococcales bacterium]|nr:hypothetical protein [Myxococcales bacterium]
MRAARLLRATLCVVAISWASATSASAITGVTALGDSLTDVHSAVTWPEIAAPLRGVNFGGPGFPYVVAQGGATSVTMLSGGQHTAAAALVQSGAADVAAIWIGGNDFLDSAVLIATGILTGPALTSYLRGIVNNIGTAMDTILAQNPARVIVVSLPPVELSPQAQQLADEAGIARLAAAVEEGNALLRDAIGARGQAYVDGAALIRDVLAGGALTLGGVTINPGNGGGDPHYFFRDGIHPSTTGQGVVAAVGLAALNVAAGEALAPLTDLEILTFAGIGGEYAGETFSTAFDLNSYVTFPPPPSSGCAVASASGGDARVLLLYGMIGAALIVTARRRA